MLVKYKMSADQLTSTFAALADPTRRAILAHLMSGEASVTELAEPFEMSMPAISRHLKVLKPRGLSPAVAPRSGAPAASKQLLSNRSPIGLRNTVWLGSSVSTACTTT